MKKVYFLLLIILVGTLGVSANFNVYSSLLNDSVGIFRECDESITEPVTYAICVEWEDSERYLNQNCFGVCALFCDAIGNFWGKLACKSGCLGICWKPERRLCIKYDTVTIYPCNGN
ncbi:MAG TPA: hypothetical protein DER56_06960 [Thermosipho africanus]|jgi:hypothetical protein|nr:hypothetical protein [Thermosipho africanus]